MRELATFAPLVVLAFWIGLYPAPFLRRIETSVGRVVARVNSVYAPVVAQGADCLTPQKPLTQTPPGLPPGFGLAEPCVDDPKSKGAPQQPGVPR